MPIVAEFTFECGKSLLGWWPIERAKTDWVAMHTLGEPCKATKQFDPYEAKQERESA